MATASRGGRFRRRQSKAAPSRILAARSRIVDVRRPGEIEAIIAAAYQVAVGDRKDARRQRALREGWQSDAWAYRDAIGELRYAVQFLANCAARMRFYPAAYQAQGETDDPVPLSELEDTPPDGFITACQQAMTDLGRGRLAIASLAETLSTNVSVAGECWMLGTEDPATGSDVWSVRSIDEIVIQDDTYKLREIPSDPQGVVPWVELDPDSTYLSRIWIPHPRFHLLADSPLRAMLDDCESLLIHRRTIRALGRSRLAGAGLLAIPEGFSIKVPDDQDDDPNADPFLDALTTAMMEPIADEGVASAVVPLVIRGPGDQIKDIQHFDFARKFDDLSLKIRDELVGIVATTFDLPKEVIVGVADLNHWSAWQVDDNTFRHHVEPHVIKCCDAVTAAYLRPRLEEMDELGEWGAWIQRVVVWYDPTELVTHPDRAKDAQAAYDRHAISARALGEEMGFSEADMPSAEETIIRMLQNMRTPPPNLVMAAVHTLFPGLTIPPVETAGTIPGVNPAGVDAGELPQLPPGSPAQPPVAIDNAPPVADAPTPISQATPPADQGPPALTAASHPDARRLSRKLAEIDRDVRTRLQAAANAAMLRQLERIGNRLRSKVAKDETLRSRIAQTRNERVSAVLGREIVAAAGVKVNDLLGNDWSGLQQQFDGWVAAAQRQALNVAARIARLPQDAPAVERAAENMASARQTAWAKLQGALSQTAEHLLYNPDPNTEAGAWGDLNPDQLVPTGTIRAALAVAGGAVLDSVTTRDDGSLAVADPLGGIGTGDIIGGLLSDAGGEAAQFEWSHGPSLDPFEGHEELDGVQFANFDDEALANNGDWPDNAYFFPGDHKGCSCDFTPLWDFPGNPSQAEEE